MDEERVIFLFKKKRSEFIKRAWISLSLFLLGSVSAVITNDILKSSIFPLICLLVMLLAAFYFIFVAVKNYRCPKCNMIPRSSVFSRKLGVSLNPLSCPNCEVKLSELADCQDKLVRAEKSWGIVAIIIGLALFIASLYVGYSNHIVFTSGDKIYGKIDEVYKANRSTIYKIKWMDEASGEAVHQITRSQDVFMYNGKAGDTGEFILCDNRIFISLWTEFYVFPLIMFLVALCFLISSIECFKLIYKDDK